MVVFLPTHVSPIDNAAKRDYFILPSVEICIWKLIDKILLILRFSWLKIHHFIYFLCRLWRKTDRLI